jgi:hypothetical protein
MSAAETMDRAQILYTIVQNMKHTEEPYAGNSPVRFCEKDGSSLAKLNNATLYISKEKREQGLLSIPK